jgi:8-oxo-dGTP pyrophosphatase MutT (NUDIX family)
LLKNYRFIVEDTLWEVPAGTLESGEDPQQAAIRELAEERRLAGTITASFTPRPGC